MFKRLIARISGPNNVGKNAGERGVDIDVGEPENPRVDVDLNAPRVDRSNIHEIRAAVGAAKDFNDLRSIIKSLADQEEADAKYIAIYSSVLSGLDNIKALVSAGGKISKTKLGSYLFDAGDPDRFTFPKTKYGDFDKNIDRPGTHVLNEILREKTRRVLMDLHRTLPDD